MDIQIHKLIKKLDNPMESFELLPWFIIVLWLLILFYYFGKIEINSYGKKWESNKCSSKYIFFSNFIGKEPAMKTLSDCIKRFS